MNVHYIHYLVKFKFIASADGPTVPGHTSADTCYIGNIGNQTTFEFIHLLSIREHLSKLKLIIFDAIASVAMLDRQLNIVCH